MMSEKAYPLATKILQFTTQGYMDENGRPPNPRNRQVVGINSTSVVNYNPGCWKKKDIPTATRMFRVGYA